MTKKKTTKEAKKETKTLAPWVFNGAKCPRCGADFTEATHVDEDRGIQQRRCLHTCRHVYTVIGKRLVTG